MLLPLPLIIIIKINVSALYTPKSNKLLNRVSCLSVYASTQPHAYAYGGAAQLQLEVGSLPVSVSWPSALHCHPCLTHCSPGNVPTPTPGNLMSTPLINTGQPTLYKRLRLHSTYPGPRSGIKTGGSAA